jgi:peptide/nickel transport system permease protein
MTSVTAEVHGMRTLADNAWIRFAVRRLWRLLVSIWVLVTAAFMMIHLVPGDPVRAALGVTASPELVEARRNQLGLNDPLWVQYTHYLRDLFAGRLGTSTLSGLPVSQVIADRYPATLELAVYAFLVAVAISV